MAITLEKLEQYYGMCSEVEAIEEELNSLYSPISSPNGRTDDTRSTMPGDPTHRTVMRIIELRAKLEEEKEQIWAEVEEIENWLETVEDHEIRSIIRWRYLMRLDWKRVNMKVYGYPDYWYSRQRVKRWFEKLSNISR